MEKYLLYKGDTGNYLRPEFKNCVIDLGSKEFDYDCQGGMPPAMIANGGYIELDYGDSIKTWRCVVCLPEVLQVYQKRITGGFSISYGGFKTYGHSIVFAAGGGNGGGFVFKEYTSKTGEVIPIGPYAGEESDFFNNCKTLEQAVVRAMEFCSRQEFVDACKTAAAGDAMGELAAHIAGGI